MSMIDNWLNSFTELQRNRNDTVVALKSFNYLLGLQALIMGIAFIGPSKVFVGQEALGFDLWYAFTYQNLEIWDIIFPVGAMALLLTTSIMRGVKIAQFFMFTIWVFFGSVWILAGIMTDGNYLFGLGLLGLFIGAQHLVFVKLWELEGVG